MDLVVVTGGGSGIGLATAQKFLQEGWKVALVGRNAKKFEQLISSYPAGRVKGYVLDLSRPLKEQEAWPAFEKEVLESEHLRALINNAGYYQPLPFEETPESSFLEHFQVNFMGPVRMLQEAWPYFLKRERGFVVNVTSTVALRPVPGTSAYAASKAALQSLTETLALEGAPHIRLNTLCPGIVETPIHSFYKSSSEEADNIRRAISEITPLGRVGRAEDVAFWAYRLCTEEASWMTGAVIKVDGGINLASKG